MNREQYLKEEKEREKENLLFERGNIRKDIQILKKYMSMSSLIQIDGHPLRDSHIMSNLMIEYKTKQIEEIDKKLGI